jgi:magnesium-transporting ATPase (P-type)
MSVCGEYQNTHKMRAWKAGLCVKSRFMYDYWMTLLFHNAILVSVLYIYCNVFVYVSLYYIFWYTILCVFALCLLAIVGFILFTFLQCWPLPKEGFWTQVVLCVDAIGVVRYLLFYGHKGQNTRPGSFGAVNSAKRLRIFISFLPGVDAEILKSIVADKMVILTYYILLLYAINWS